MIIDGHFIISQMTYLLERQFPPTLDSLWIRHYGSTYDQSSLPSIVKDVMEIDKHEFHKRVSDILKSKRNKVNLLEIEKLMERNSAISLGTDSGKSVIYNQYDEKVLIVKGSQRETYLIQHNVKRLIKDGATLTGKGYTFEQVQTISDEVLDKYIDGPTLTLDDINN